MRPIVNLYNLGRAPYVRALKIQQLLFEKLKTFRSPLTNSLLLVEHEPVYTVGIRTKEYDDNYVFKLKHELNKHQMEADFVRTNRGGLITFHGPGQLVAYPIIYLGDFTSKIPNKSVKAYVNRLESTIVDTLTAAGLQGAHTMREYPGVWLDGGNRKIAFIGISCKRYVTMHGISINCDCDLSWFDHIVSCGIEDKSITSIHQEMSLKGNRQHLNGHTKSSNILSSSSSKLSTIASDVRTQSNFSSESDYTTGRAQFNLGEEFSKYDVKRVADLFCESFSVNFDCDLRDGDFEQDIGTASDVFSLEC